MGRSQTQLAPRDEMHLTNYSARRINRLLAFSILLMALGWLGLALRSPGGYGCRGAWLALAGVILMVNGIAAQFWLFTDSSYACSNARLAAWETFLLVAAIGATVSGTALLQTQHSLCGGGSFLALALPLFIFGFHVAPFLGPAVLALMLGWLLRIGGEALTIFGIEAR